PSERQVYAFLRRSVSDSPTATPELPTQRAELRAYRWRAQPLSLPPRRRAGLRRSPEEMGCNPAAIPGSATTVSASAGRVCLPAAEGPVMAPGVPPATCLGPCPVHCPAPLAAAAERTMWAESIAGDRAGAAPPATAPVRRRRVRTPAAT